MIIALAKGISPSLSFSNEKDAEKSHKTYLSKGRKKRRKWIASNAVNANGEPTKRQQTRKKKAAHNKRNKSIPEHNIW